MNSPLLPQLPPGGAGLAFFTPIHHFPGLADRKAAFLVSACGLVVIVLFFFATQIHHIATHPTRIYAYLLVALLIALNFALAATVYLSWKAFMQAAPPPSPDTLVHYTRIAARRPQEYLNQVHDIPWPQAVRDILHYNYSVSIQIRQKFQLVNRAFYFFRWTLILWMSVILLISIVG